MNLLSEIGNLSCNRNFFMMPDDYFVFTMLFKKAFINDVNLKQRNFAQIKWIIFQNMKKLFCLQCLIFFY